MQVNGSLRAVSASLKRWLRVKFVNTGVHESPEILSRAAVKVKEAGAYNELVTVDSVTDTLRHALP